jgi:hypothetical protein
MIAQQPQGGLGQVSQPPQAKPPVMPQGKPAQKTDQAADADRIAAEQITAQDEPFDVNKEITNLNKGRMQLDAQIQKMQESLAKRTTLPYDPKFMALGVGLAQPTKTGQFVESLGQGMGEFHKATLGEKEREATADTQNLELMMKQQQLRQKLAGSAMLQNLGGGMGGAPQAGGTPLGGLAVPAGGAGMTSGATTAGAPPTAGMPQSRPGLPTTVTGFAPIGRRELVAGQQIGDPDTEKFLFNLQKAEVEAKKAADAGFTEVTIPYSDKKVKVRTEVADGFFDAAKQAATTGNEQILIRFMAQNGMITPTRKQGTTGEAQFERPMSEAELAAQKTTQEAIARERATASEKSGNALLQRGEIAPKLENLANNILSLTDSNTRAFNLMQDATVRDAVLRAIEQGANVNVGSMSVGINLPVRIALQGNKEYKLTKYDITALQMFQQTQAEITAEMRKIGREPGEGATDKTEGQLYAALGVLPSDSARALALKAEAMVQRGRYDARAAQLWLKAQEEFPNKSFSSFKLNDPEFKELQKNYRQTLDDMRNKNADILRTSPKTPAPAAGQSGGERKPPKGWKKMPDGSFEKE